METRDAIKKIGLILLGITLILIAVFAVPHYVAQEVQPIIEIIIVFFVLVLAYLVVWKAM
jgi:hypothetical protein